MEEFEFWVKIANKTGVKLRLFQELKKRTINVYNRVQDNINTIKEKLSIAITENGEIFDYENYLCELGNAIKKQDTLIMIYSLSIFLQKIKRFTREMTSKSYFKNMIKICDRVIKRLSNTHYIDCGSIVDIAIQKISNYQSRFLLEAARI